MLNGVTFSDSENNAYFFPDILGNSSRSEVPYNEDGIERLAHHLTKRKGFRKDIDLWLTPSVNFDFSSVSPHFEISNETYQTGGVSEEDIICAILENDYVVKTPKKKRKVRLKIRNVKRYNPRVRNPEEF